MCFIGQNKIIALFTLFFFLFTPIGQAWADSFSNSAADGQSVGKQSVPTYNDLIDDISNVVTTDGSDGEDTFSQAEIFPGSAEGNSASLQGLYGNSDEGLRNSVADTQERLAEEESHTGEAYRTLNSSMHERSHPDMRNDPVWGQTDSTFNSVFNKEFSDCSVVTSYTSRTDSSKVSDIKTCERIEKPKECTATRYVRDVQKYAVAKCVPGSTLGVINGYTFKCGSDGLAYEVDNGIGTIPGALAQNAAGVVNGVSLSQECSVAGNRLACKVGVNGVKGTFYFDFVDVDHFIPESFYYSFWMCDSCNPFIYFLGPNGIVAKAVRDGGAYGKVTNYTYSQEKCVVTDDSGIPDCYVQTQTSAAYEHLLGPTVNVSGEAGNVPFEEGDIVTWLSFGGGTGMFSFKNQGFFVVKPDGALIKLITYGNKPWYTTSGMTAPPPTIPWLHVVEDIVYEPEGCNESSYCDTEDTQWQCVNDDFHRINGVDITPTFAKDAGMLPLYPGDTHDPRVCYSASVPMACDFNVGMMQCWTDPQGETHCPENTGEIEDTCQQYEDDPNCGFISSDCIEGARDEYGYCFAYTDVYDCGPIVEYDTKIRHDEYVCDGSGIRCMGSECLELEAFQSDDFQKAAALLSAAEFMANDMNCNGEAETNLGTSQVLTCEVFGGEGYSCKKALGGWVDCCDQPTQTSLADYISFTLKVNKLTNASDILSKTDVVQGAWTSIKSGVSSVTTPISETFSKMTKPFTSAWQSITGTATDAAAEATTQLSGQAAEAATQGVIGQAQQWLTDKLAEWVYNTFGEAVYDTFFTTAAEATIGEAGFAQWGGSNALGSMLSSVISVVMWAYLIYQIVNILVQIIWACEESEFELASKRELKSCSYVGSYCASEVFGACIEKRDAFCCFNSPLSRILNEQIRRQLGMPYGNPESPSCSGFSLDQMALVDWDEVDLSEWIAMLSMTGNLPDGSGNLDLSMEGLTGSMSALETYDQTGVDRLNTADRAINRLDSSEADNINEDLRQGLWGQ